MKIVQVSAYYPPHIGGIEYCAKNISEQLAKNGHTVTVLTSNVGRGKPQTVKRGNLTEKYLTGIEFAHTPIIPSLPLELLRIDKESVVHIHLSHVYTELLVFIITTLRRIPYVAHFHMDVDASGRLGLLFKIYKRIILPYVIRKASKVIALSQEQREIVLKRYRAKPKNVVIIPNGVKNDFFMERIFYESDTPTNLLFVGRFALQKNIPRLLRALPLMQHDVHLHLVGDGEKLPQIKQIIQELNIQNVTLHGPQNGKKLVDMYRKADIFVLPSDREGMPLVLLEAMAAGLLVVASNVQGIREFIKNNGLLVNNPSPETFANTLDNLIGDQEKLQKLSNRGRAWAKNYSWEKLVHKIEKVYTNVLLI